MTTQLYKSFDSSEFLLEVMWKMFPTILTDVNASGEIINRLIISSDQFCSLKRNNFFRIKYFSEGSFGDVGELKRGGYSYKAAVMSWDPRGKYSSVFYTDVIVKMSKNIINNKIEKLNLSTIAVTDPLSDMIFGSLLGHLYDLGVCPFVTKYFGTYMCSDNQTTMILEKADRELRDLILKDEISKFELKIILMQFLYACFILKSYFGMVNFDTHLRNIMVKDITKSEYRYNGKELSKTNFLVFETGLKEGDKFILVVVPMTRHIVKLIDYGSMLAAFDRSLVKKFKRDLRIQTDRNTVKSIGAEVALDESRESISFANTVDVLFTLINVYELGRLSGKNWVTSVADEVARSIFKGLSMKDFLTANPQFITRTMANGQPEWFMRRHESGIKEGFSNVLYLPEAMISLCKNTSTGVCQLMNNYYTGKEIVWKSTIDSLITADINDDNTLFLLNNYTDYSAMFNRFEKISAYDEKCSSGENVFCKISKMYRQYPLETFLDEKEIFNDENMVIFIKDGEVFKTEQNSTWMNFNTASPRKSFRVKYSLIKTKKSARKVSLRKAQELLPSTAHISFPVGKFVIKKDKLSPLGFFANENPLEISYNHYPQDYWDFLAVLNSPDGTGFRLEKMTNFFSRHKTVSKKIHLDAVTSEEVLIPKFFPLELERGSKYKWAVTLGPVLIWDRRNIFNIDAESSVVLPGNSGKKIFRGGGPGYYGMQDSNEIQSHLVLIERKNQMYLLLVDGGGFSSVGVNRVSLTKICENIGAEKAVCVHSGFSSNAIINISENAKFLGKSTIRLPHAAIIDIEF